MKKAISILALVLISTIGYSQANQKQIVNNLNFIQTPSYSVTTKQAHIGRNLVYSNDTLASSGIVNAANFVTVIDGKDSSQSQLAIHGVLKLGGLSTTGTKTVTIGATAPTAVRTVATAYEWIQVRLWNDSLVYIPCWK